MTEQEKMMADLPFDPTDPTLAGQRKAAKEQCAAYNAAQAQGLSEEAQQKLLTGLVHAQGNVDIRPDFWCDYGYNITLGDNFFANHHLVILDSAKVTFGKNVFVGPNCGFYTACHPIDYKTRNTWLEFAKPITVGDNVWFGGSVTVLPGVKIGSGSVIGAGSVVVKDIPENVVAVGNPCTPIRKIATNEEA